MTLYHLYLSIPKFLSGAAGNDTGDRVRAVSAEMSGPIGMKKRPDSMKAIRAQKLQYSLTE